MPYVVAVARVMSPAAKNVNGVICGSPTSPAMMLRTDAFASMLNSGLDAVRFAFLGLNLTRNDLPDALRS